MNITKQEEKALKELLYDDSIVIRPSDKTSGIVVINRGYQPYNLSWNGVYINGDILNQDARRIAGITFK